MKNLACFAVVLALAGCGYVTATQEFSPYVGKPIAMVIAQYGAPASSTTVNGNTFDSWTIERRRPGAFPGLHSDCLVTFMVDAKGNVSAYTVHKTGGLETSDSCQ